MILCAKAGMARLLWDRQTVIYHHGPGERTDWPLSKVLNAIKTADDTEPQQPPVGYAVIGWHVDDGLGVACSVGWNQDYKSNRIVQYIKGTIEVTYATTLTGWHGNKALGFTLLVDETERTVEMSAMDAIKKLGNELLKHSVNIQPKHVMTTMFADIPKGEVPAEGDPTRESVLQRMSLTRHALGVFIWVGLAHPQCQMPTNELCENMDFPHERTLQAVSFMTMHMLANPHGTKFGRVKGFGLEQPAHADLSDPYVSRPAFCHWWADANLTTRSRTGGVCMLANGCIMGISQRQQLKAPCAHSSEAVGAGTNFSLAVPVCGVLQELRIQLGIPLPFYLDSITTVFVSTSDTAIKKSVWLIRRAEVLQEGVSNGDLHPIHISERDMCADPMTKYLPQAVWARHMHYMLNKPGPVPPYPEKGARRGGICDESA